VTAAILVGGEARRLGGAVKSSLLVGNRSILERQLDAVHDAGIDHITLVGRWRHPAIRRVAHVADAVPGAGALGGMYTALLAGTGRVVLVLAGDMPFLRPPWLRMLCDLGDADAKVPRRDGRWHPLCAAYRRTAALAVKARLDRGRLRVTDALADLRVREVTSDEIAEFDPTGMLLMNVNTRDDYDEANRLAPPQV
jgi:molybdopterin-guanine dinucleotide biosynthesis protein A